MNLFFVFSATLNSVQESTPVVHVNHFHQRPCTPTQVCSVILAAETSAWMDGGVNYVKAALCMLIKLILHVLRRSPENYGTEITCVGSHRRAEAWRKGTCTLLDSWELNTSRSSSSSDKGHLLYYKAFEHISGCWSAGGVCTLVIEFIHEVVHCCWFLIFTYLFYLLIHFTDSQ